ncbi:hypothetical protein OIU77_030455 [Salix suchowensis]|uniref:Uncharacterized protein n=1 Tax=Salix suchowensis TaxID=1278906 RepID=A0ABQ9BCC7_9ROSI|nr:hypothetical protein OIU77_030455 [Salix suchowensis]
MISNVEVEGLYRFLCHSFPINIPCEYQITELTKDSSWSSLSIHSSPVWPPRTIALVPPTTQVLCPQANLGGRPGTFRILHVGFSSVGSRR